MPCFIVDCLFNYIVRELYVIKFENCYEFLCFIQIWEECIVSICILKYVALICFYKCIMLLKCILKIFLFIGTGLPYVSLLKLLVQVFWVLTNFCLPGPSISYRSPLRSTILLVILLGFSLFILRNNEIFPPFYPSSSMKILIHTAVLSLSAKNAHLTSVWSVLHTNV